MHSLKTNIICLLTFFCYHLYAQQQDVLQDSVSIILPSSTLDKAKILLENEWSLQAVKKEVYGKVQLNQNSFDAAIHKYIQEPLKKEGQIPKYEAENKFKSVLSERVILGIQEGKIFSSESFIFKQQSNQVFQQDISKYKQTETTQEPTIVLTPKIFIDPSEKDIQLTALLPDLSEENINVEKQFRGPSQYDSRIEINDLNPDINSEFFMLITNSAVGMVVEKEKLTQISSNFYEIDISNTLQSQLNLCNTVAFGSQPIAGIGTAFIINENTMLTAGHVFQRPIQDYAIVFGFEISTKAGAVNRTIHKSNIFYPTKDYKILYDLDVAIFKTSKVFNNKSTLSLGVSRSLTKEHPIYMIGHPSGLPKKIAVNASILDNNHAQYFYTSLDGFQGNSGSPVFNFITNQVIGVLVSGETDYVFNGNCYEDNICRVPYCKGEKVIRIETIMKNLD